MEQASEANESNLSTEAKMGQIPSTDPSDKMKNTGGKAKKSNTSSETKTRMILSTGDEHPFTKFLMEIKRRNVKNFDLNTFIGDILSELPSTWWDEKIESLTPLEYKINAALSDPEMREKLTSLLASEKLKSEDNQLHS